MPGRRGATLTAKQFMMRRAGVSAPNLQEEINIFLKPANGKQQSTAVYGLSTEERFGDSGRTSKQGQPSLRANGLSKAEGAKIGDLWGFELDNADGKDVTGLVRVHGDVDIVRMSGAKST